MLAFVITFFIVIVVMSCIIVIANKKFNKFKNDSGIKELSSRIKNALSGRYSENSINHTEKTQLKKCEYCGGAYEGTKCPHCGANETKDNN